MFGCTTGLFNEVNGRYVVDGPTIFLNPSRDFWKNTLNDAGGRGFGPIPKYYGHPVLIGAFSANVFIR